MDKIPDYDRYSATQRKVALAGFEVFFWEAANADRSLTRPDIDDSTDLKKLHEQAIVYRQIMAVKRAQ